MVIVGRYAFDRSQLGQPVRRREGEVAAGQADLTKRVPAPAPQRAVLIDRASGVRPNAELYGAAEDGGLDEGALLRRAARTTATRSLSASPNWSLMIT